jgi:hypothetical protein
MVFVLKNVMLLEEMAVMTIRIIMIDHSMATEEVGAL